MIKRPGLGKVYFHMGWILFEILSWPTISLPNDVYIRSVQIVLDWLLRFFFVIKWMILPSKIEGTNLELGTFKTNYYYIEKGQ